MVRYLNYMVQFLRFQSDTTNNDVRNTLLNISQKCLLIWFGLPPALFQFVLAATVTLVAQPHAVLKGKPLTVVGKHLLARCQDLLCDRVQAGFWAVWGCTGKSAAKSRATTWQLGSGVDCGTEWQRMASHFSGLCRGNVRLSRGKNFQCEHGINGRGWKWKERHSETTCMEAAGGARSGVKELLCATWGFWERGKRDAGTDRAREGACRSRSISLKDKKRKNGLAMQESGQEDGSQSLKRSRGGGATVEWRQSCRRNEGSKRRQGMSGDQDIKLEERRKKGEERAICGR